MKGEGPAELELGDGYSYFHAIQAGQACGTCECRARARENLMSQASQLACLCVLVSLRVKGRGQVHAKSDECSQ